MVSDSDDSTFSDSEAEHAELLHGRHTVALDGKLEESEVQRGLYNRHNFLVNTYNNVAERNFMQIQVLCLMYYFILTLKIIPGKGLNYCEVQKRSFLAKKFNK